MMSAFIHIWIGMSVASLVCLGDTAYAQSTPPEPPPQVAPTEAPAQPPPPPVEVKSCWRPGMARNSGIAEPSCDAPMAAKVRRSPPESKGAPGGDNPEAKPSSPTEPDGPKPS